MTSSSCKLASLKREEDISSFSKAKGKHALLFHRDTSRHGPSKQMLDVLENFQEDFPSVAFGLVEVKDGAIDPNSFAAACQVEEVPTICFCEDGEYLGKFVGADPPLVVEGLMAWSNIGKDSLRSSLQSMQPQHQLPLNEKKEESLDARLRRLVTSHPVMVFMKGHRDAPFCRFSKQLMAIFADQKLVGFEAFDVFQDEQVREGLKKFSNWPTYPQVYVKGELIGGVDIIKAMVEDGSFRDAFPKEAFSSS